MISKVGIWLPAIAVQCTMAAAMAANPEQVDYSCPTSPKDQPAVFAEGTQALDYPGVIHIEDHSQDYRLTFTPRFDMRLGYIDNILIVGHKYTLDPVTQKKTYLFAKDEFRQRIVDIPINYCRSHRAPYSPRGDMTLGQLSVQDESGHAKSSWVAIRVVLSCDEVMCVADGLAVNYGDQYGELANVQLGQGWLNQDLRIFKRVP